jgi:uncharacterized protein (DUF433 family)
VDYTHFIEIKPDKRFGKPCLIGTRISVLDILNMLANNMTYQEIIKDFPEINEEHIKVCLAYAANREGKSLVANGEL